MKWFWALALVTLPCTFAQATPDETPAIVAQLPTCSLTCLISGVANSTCAATDSQCLCHNAPLTAAVQVCVLSSCTIKESLSFANITTSLLCGAPKREIGAAYNGVVLAGTICSGSAIVLRLIARYIGDAKFWYDDWLLLLLLLVDLSTTHFHYNGLAGNGLGSDLWTIPFPKITKLLKIYWIGQILYYSLLGLLKASFLFFYLRIFPSKSFRRVVWFTIAFNFVFSLIFVFLAMFQCQPVSYAWTRWDGEHPGKCLHTNSIAWSNAGVSIVLDLVMLTLPIWQLWGLQMKWRKKLGVAAMLCLGAIVTIISMIRLRSLVQLRGASNFSWDYVQLSMWSTIEIHVAGVCACLPQIRQLFTPVFKRIGVFVTTKNSSGYRKSNNEGKDTPGTGSEVSGKKDGQRNIRRETFGGRKSPSSTEELDFELEHELRESNIELTSVVSEGENGDRAPSAKGREEVRQKAFV